MDLTLVMVQMWVHLGVRMNLPTLLAVTAVDLLGILQYLYFKRNRIK